MIKERIVKYLRKISLKNKKNLTEHSLLAALSVYKKLRNIIGKSDNKAVSKLYIRTKSLERNFIGAKYSFITVDDLVIWTTEWIKSFENNYDIILGIPRSGLLVANIIALKLGKPLSTPELLQRKLWKSNRRMIKRESVVLINNSNICIKIIEGYKKYFLDIDF